MTNQTSLLPAGEQLELIPSSEMDDGVFFFEEAEGHFTGERLVVQRPETYQMVVSLLAEGLSARQVARLAKVSPNTVAMVREREPAAIDAVKRNMVSTVRGMSQLCLDRMREMLVDPDVKIGAKDLGIMYGILTEKAELLAGAPTSRLETTPTTTDYVDHIEWLKSVTAKEVTGYSREIEGEKADGAGDQSAGLGDDVGAAGDDVGDVGDDAGAGESVAPARSWPPSGPDPGRLLPAAACAHNEGPAPHRKPESIDYQRDTEVPNLETSDAEQAETVSDSEPRT
jgi:hypothetical protein